MSDNSLSAAETPVRTSALRKASPVGHDTPNTRTREARLCFVWLVKAGFS